VYALVSLRPDFKLGHYRHLVVSAKTPGGVLYSLPKVFSDSQARYFVIPAEAGIRSRVPRDALGSLVRKKDEIARER